MSAAATTPGARPQAPRNRFHIANLGDHIFRGVCALSAAWVIVLFVLLAAVLVWQSWAAITGNGLHFFTSANWDPSENIRDFGSLAFVYGTVVTSAIAMLLAVPLGVGTATYLSEISSGWIRKVVSFLVEMLAAIPSVVYGFWARLVLAPLLQPIYAAMGGPTTGGYTLLTAGLVLAVMVVPYVTSVSFDVCRAVPHSQRQAALALGSTRWQMISTAVLPFARPGIVGACFLALGRAIGETMAVTMVIGARQEILWSPLAAGESIASGIAAQFSEASYELFQASLTELALVLMAVSIVVNSLARLLIWRVSVSRAFVPVSALPWWQRPWRWLTEAGGLLLFRGLPLFALAYFSHFVVALSFRRPDFLPVGGLYEDYRPEIVNVPVLAVLWGVTLWGCQQVLIWQARHAETFARIVDRLMTGVLAAAVVLTVGPLFVILTHLVIEGSESLFTVPSGPAPALAPGQLPEMGPDGLPVRQPREFGFNWAFFTDLPRPPGEEGGGMANALFGSALMVGLASLFAIPVGLLAAIYLAEYRSNWFGSVVRFVGELLAGVPSIAVGLVGYYVLVRPMLGPSAWAGAFVLSIMMIPIVMRASEESLKLVPSTLRSASYALGATQWQTVLRIVVPAALPAIITGVFLSIARVGGETAPLILTSGYTPFMPRQFKGPTPSVPVFIYTFAVSPYPSWHRQAWAAALVLLVIIMLLNFGIRFLTGKRVVLASRAD